MKKISKVWLILCSGLIVLPVFGKPPRLTVVIIVDQLSHYLIQRHESHFKGAFKHFLDQGLWYEQANFPHAAPVTAAGHTALSTGTYVHNHGIVGNYWYDKTGEKKIKCVSDSPQVAGVFSPDGMYDTGVSAKNIMVDGISDQYMIARGGLGNAVYSFSLKARAAIGLGNHRGKSLWFDEKSGRMTTSKAFFDEIPSWIASFNKKHPVNPHGSITWRLAHPSHSAYRLNHAQDDNFSVFSLKTTRKEITLTPKTEFLDAWSKQYKWFALTPQANQYLLDCAYSCIEQTLSRHQNMLVWISLSPLDKLGHQVGPYSIAMSDMLYHLDKQLDTFMNAIRQLAGNKCDVLYVLTGDHGCMPIPELLAQDGYPAMRLDVADIIKKTNGHIEEVFGIKDFIKRYRVPHFFIDETLFETYPPKQREAIVREVKQTISAMQGIKQVWTYHELARMTFQKHSLEEHYKQQLFPQRSGYFIVQPQPYVLLGAYKLGTGHKTPYNYDTQVPIMLYCPGTLAKKRIKQQVWATQLPATLAKLLEIPKPSAATFDVLPGIFQ